MAKAVLTGDPDHVLKPAQEFIDRTRTAAKADGTIETKGTTNAEKTQTPDEDR